MRLPSGVTTLHSDYPITCFRLLNTLFPFKNVADFFSAQPITSRKDRELGISPYFLPFHWTIWVHLGRSLFDYRMEIHRSAPVLRGLGLEGVKGYFAVSDAPYYGTPAGTGWLHTVVYHPIAGLHAVDPGLCYLACAKFICIILT
jgi:hypothetical protein